ncbi:MAG: class I SAM-dependent methyltransferase [Maribacter sp.]
MEGVVGKMKRIQLFEFEDFIWFPGWLRICMTNLIVILQKMIGIPEVLSGLIANVLRKKNLLNIVDLGSGSGGVMPEVMESLRNAQNLKNIQMVLTDLYPNPEMYKKFNINRNDQISYIETSVDATNIAPAPEGLKTMINSFHHMPPKKARAILESAQRTNQPLLIYEMGVNNIPLLIWWLLLPISLIILIIMVLFMTPFVKPLTWRQIAFTYLIPIIPLCYAWDGQASFPRMYTLKDLDVLLEGLGSDNYTWEKGFAKKKNGKKQGTYLLGIPNGTN